MNAKGQEEIIELTQENFAAVLSQTADEANDVTRELKKHFPLRDMVWMPHYNSPDRWLFYITYKAFYTDTYICYFSYSPRFNNFAYYLAGRKEIIGITELPNNTDFIFNQVGDLDSIIERLMLFVQLQYGETATRYHVN